VNKVSCFESPGAIGTGGNDYDVGGLHGLVVENKCPSGGAQNLSPDARYTNRHSARQHKYRHDLKPSPPMSAHVCIIYDEAPSVPTRNLASTAQSGEV